MKKGTYVLIIALFFIILFAATAVSFVYLDLSRSPEVKPESYLEIKIEGMVEDYAAPDFLTFLDGRDCLVERANLEDIGIVPAFLERRVREDETDWLVERQ